MKRFAFPEIWVQEPRYHPSLARAQCASVCCGFSHVTLLYHCHMPSYPLPSEPWSLSELIHCLSRVSPLGRWIPKAGERLLPTWSARLGAFLSAERMQNSVPLCGPRARGRSKEPQTCHAALRSTLWLGLCVYRLIKSGSQAKSK